MMWFNFIVGSLVLLWLSRKPLRQKGSHGFYRFLAWECILAIIVLNLPEWGQHFWSWYQMISAVILLASIVFLVLGLRALKQFGKAAQSRADDALYGFERTTQLVTDGIFAYVRHPMYGSLILLAWGAAMQNPHSLGFVLAAAASYWMYRTAVVEEGECTAYFGLPYADYMRQSKRFVPYLF